MVFKGLPLEQEPNSGILALQISKTRVPSFTAQPWNPRSSASIWSLGMLKEPPSFWMLIEPGKIKFFEVVRVFLRDQPFGWFHYQKKLMNLRPNSSPVEYELMAIVIAWSSGHKCAGILLLQQNSKLHIRSSNRMPTHLVTTHITHAYMIF